MGQLLAPEIQPQSGRFETLVHTIYNDDTWV